jgi:hypothetical protein
MKLVDSKGRLFGVLNVIDFTSAALVILAVIAALSYFSLRDNGNGETGKVVYEIEFSKQTKTFVDSIEMGDTVAAAEQGVTLGTVISKKVSPSVTVNPDLVQGKYVKSQVPDAYDAVITVEAQGLISEKDITINGFKIITGKELPVKGKGYVSNAVILGIKINP